jgi:hypothetical protein
VGRVGSSAPALGALRRKPCKIGARVSGNEKARPQGAGLFLSCKRNAPPGRVRRLVVGA